MFSRFITKLKIVPDTEEHEYTSNVIYENFSNYSAGHNRCWRILFQRSYILWSAILQNLLGMGQQRGFGGEGVVPGRVGLLLLWVSVGGDTTEWRHGVYAYWSQAKEPLFSSHS